MFQAIHPKQCENCAFPQNFRTRKSGEITVFFAVIALDKLASTEIYSILISIVQIKPSSNINFGNMLNDYNIDWAAIYMLSRLITFKHLYAIFSTQYPKQ